ncbi:flavin-dependent dehydrogenase [Spirulina major CS-329]|nr:flavin-dependent dehydrogenase [Spirulina major]MDB9495789.1 flavin-dependent dehydrogenase [Spirulina subsalsa CS-330]MDB9503775.1 flavin-dependent dehydrogenase [Spirulina major CS-329]
MSNVLMNELLYLEIPTPDLARVVTWLQTQWQPPYGERVVVPGGVQVQFPERPGQVLAIALWSLQRTTYLKLFRWSDRPLPHERDIQDHLSQALPQAFPLTYPAPPALDLTQTDIFTALAPHYPQTVNYFQKMPQGERDLQRAYWWETRWRESVKNPQTPRSVVFQQSTPLATDLDYDLIYIGGALGVIHAAVMAQRGYRVLLIERLAFGRMNREWNISRDEFQQLIELGLFTAEEFEGLIAREYQDGFNKFFDGNNPPHLKAKVLHTPTVLNIAIDSERLLRLCGEKFRQAGGEIWDETEFTRVDVARDGVQVQMTHRPTGRDRNATARLVVDAMGTASPIAWQLNGGRTFDSVCPTVGAVLSGISKEVWNPDFGDVLNSHGDISRGRQLIWELFPVEGDDLTVYLFHYHQVHPENPGSLLEMYEDFFTILPEYRRCDLDALEWKKPTFGYIPGHFSVGGSDRTVAIDRIVAIGDAASLQSPLVFTGFGSLVRNLGRLTTLLDTALQHDLLAAKHLNTIRAYQSNTAVTWLFSKGMMVPTGKTLPPQRVNAMLNTFFGLLAEEPPEVADTFIKDRFGWWTFNRLALKAAVMNPRLVPWIWEQAGTRDFIRWIGSYLWFAVESLLAWCLRGWFPGWLARSQPWLESRYPALWLHCLSLSLRINSSLGRSPHITRLPEQPSTRREVSVG